MKKIILIALSFLVLVACNSPKKCTLEQIIELISYNKLKELKECSFDSKSFENVGAKVNPFWVALDENKLEIAKYIATKGYNPFMRDDEDKPINQYVEDKNHIEILNYLKEFQLNFWLNNNPVYTSEAMDIAIEFDNELLVQNLLENNYNINESNSNGFKPIVYAAFCGSKASVKTLLKNKANPSSVFDTRPCITIAAMFNNLEIAKNLIAAGADINQTEGNRVSALMYAVDDGYTDMAKLLIEHGAVVDTIDGNGLSILARAKKTNNVELIKLINLKITATE